MAKRKKHRKKKQVKRTAPATQARVTSKSIAPKPVKEVKSSTPAQTEIAEAGSAKEARLVKADVRYGLILVGIIALIFVLLYVLLQNPTVSAKVYGLIKLPNIGN